MNQSLESESALAPEPASSRAAPEVAEAAADAGPGTGPASEGAGPAALADLVAAGLVSHEMIGDPARLGAEAAALRLLCAHVPGSIWRIEPYHYAFRLEAGADPEAAGAALEARLVAEFGPDAAWVSPADLIAEADAASTSAGTTSGAGAGAGAVDLDAPLLLLQASAEAVAEGIAYAGPGVQAVVSAGFAARAARIAAARIGADRPEAAASEGDPALAGRLAGLEAGQARLEAALAAEAESRAAAAAAELRLTELLAKVLRRLDAQADVLHGHIAREDKVAGRLDEIAALANGGPAAAFQETLGLALAEFLARLERREAAAGQGPARVPQVS